MTLDNAQQHLAELINSGDPVFAQAAQQVADLTAQAQAGELSAAELQEILADMQRQLNIIEEMNQLAFKEKLNAVLAGLIVIASAV